MKFYITTPLYYVNAPPHIGHSYTNIVSDCIARYKRLKRHEVFFLTGTDEHGQKVAAAAEKAGLSPQRFADSVVARFEELWKKLHISYDDFIRTTQTRHTRTVEKVIEILNKNGLLYQGQYKGWYCIPCETFWTKTQATQPICPDCQRPLEEISETNFFFSLSKYQRWLIDYIQTHPDFILPQVRRNEVLSFLQNPLQDLCISRPKSRLSWAIPMPLSPEHVVYVWFDALINYISGAGYLSDKKRFQSLWPADVHIIGKDILRHHAVFWPIMLHAIGLEPPKTIFAHGWWTLGGEKISKSKGKVIDPLEVVDKFGIDGFRYFLLREVSFGLDGVYSEEAFITRFNSDLANDLGNLLNRSLTMVEKYFSGVVPGPGPEGERDALLRQKAEGLAQGVENSMDKFSLNAALASIWDVINAANKYIEDSAPWTLAKEKNDAALSTVIYYLMETLRIVTILISPFMPATASSMWDQLGLKEKLEEVSFDKAKKWGITKQGLKVKKGKPLFPRIER